MGVRPKRHSEDEIAQGWRSLSSVCEVGEEGCVQDKEGVHVPGVPLFRPFLPLLPFLPNLLLFFPLLLPFSPFFPSSLPFPLLPSLLFPSLPSSPPLSPFLPSRFLPPFSPSLPSSLPLRFLSPSLFPPPPFSLLPFLSGVTYLGQVPLRPIFFYIGQSYSGQAYLGQFLGQALFSQAYPQYSPCLCGRRLHTNMAYARLSGFNRPSGGASTAEGRPKVGDAPHEGLLKVERREFRFRCLGFKF